MKSNPYFSIVLPIYNVEEYLHQCIDSILKQDFVEFELILVDDGSPDGCPQICDEYAMIDSRVQTIHKPNGGLSSARNAGMKAANGQYIIFVDSDDYWNSEHALTLIHRKLESAESQIDVLVFNNVDYSCRTGKSEPCNRQYDTYLMEHSSKEVVLPYLLRNGLFPGAAWVTVTKRSFLMGKQLFFIEGIKAEDVDWLMKVFLEANSYSALNEAFYVYRKYRSGSITGTVDAKVIDDLLYTVEIWKEKLRNEEYKYIADDMLGLLAHHFLSVMLTYANITSDKKREYGPKLRKNKYVLRYGKGIAFQILRIMPISLASHLLMQMRKMKQSG